MTRMYRAPAAAGAHLLSIADLDADELVRVLEQAAELRIERGSLPLGRPPLERRSVALLFDKPSLRTRVSFEVGIAKLGGVTTSLTGGEIGLGTREPVEDIARTLSRYVDAIVVRMLDHGALAAMAHASDVPVVNALTSHEHPCQALADLLTLQVRLGRLAGRQLVYVGDGNNVCHSLLLGGAALGLHVRVATPAGHEPAAAVVDEAVRLGRDSGSRIEVVHDPRAAVAGADAVYTDVWASMGAEDERESRRRTFAGFRLTEELLTGAPTALVMHCLPAHRGEEIDGQLLEGPRSVVFDQAENRLYVQQALLLHLLRSGRVNGRSVPFAARNEQPVMAGAARR